MSNDKSCQYGSYEPSKLCICTWRLARQPQSTDLVLHMLGSHLADEGSGIMEHIGCTAGNSGGSAVAKMGKVVMGIRGREC